MGVICFWVQITTARTSATFKGWGHSLPLSHPKCSQPWIWRVLTWGKKKKDGNFASMFSNFAVTATSCGLMQNIFHKASWGLFMFSSCPRVDMVKDELGRTVKAKLILCAGFQSSLLFLIPASSTIGGKRVSGSESEARGGTWQDPVYCYLCSHLEAIARFEL